MYGMFVHKATFMSVPTLKKNLSCVYVCCGPSSSVGIATDYYGRGVLLTTHHLLVPWSWKSRAIPLSTLWATTGPVMRTLYLLSVRIGDCSTAHMSFRIAEERRYNEV